MESLRPALFILLLISIVCATKCLPDNNEAVVSSQEDARDNSMAQIVDNYQPK